MHAFWLRLKFALMWVPAICVVGVPLYLVQFGVPTFHGHPSPRLTPYPTPAGFVPVTWSITGYGCADGWASPSLGERGACSHHGGEVTVYLGSNGQQLRCAQLTRPPRDVATEIYEVDTVGQMLCL